jgi:hypothetical protein
MCVYVIIDTAMPDVNNKIDTNATVTVMLKGPPALDDQPQLAQFLKFCGKVGRCLRIIEGRDLDERQRVRLVVADLRTGSAVMQIAALPPQRGADRRQAIVAEFRHTVRSLQNGLPISHRLTYSELRDFRTIAAPLQSGATEAWIDDVRITTQYTANIDRILEGGAKSTGSISGRLERLNVHNANEFSLFPAVSDDEILCKFPDELWGTVQQAIKRTVTVLGEMTYRPDTAFPDRVRVESIEIHPDDDDLPTLMDLHGLFGDECTNGQTAEEFIRAIRNEQEA